MTFGFWGRHKGRHRLAIVTNYEKQKRWGRKLKYKKVPLSKIFCIHTTDIKYTLFFHYSWPTFAYLHLYLYTYTWNMYGKTIFKLKFFLKKYFIRVSIFSAGTFAGFPCQFNYANVFDVFLQICTLVGSTIFPISFSHEMTRNFVSFKKKGAPDKQEPIPRRLNLQLCKTLLSL
jgi:hypothetical protein